MRKNIPASKVIYMEKKISVIFDGTAHVCEAIVVLLMTTGICSNKL